MSASTPTGKKRLKQAILERDFDYILSQGLSQVEAGADILDVNMGMPDIDEAALLPEVVQRLQSVLDTPLQIDSSNPKAVENALRLYNGKAIVNSVNGEERSMQTILPLVKKYGAAVVALTMDEKGIPLTAQERFAVAERIVSRAAAYGIPREDIFVDCLTLTASVQQKEVVETLKAMRMVKEKLGCRTVLGVSNISFGLPNRELLNHSFLLMALEAGWTCRSSTPTSPRCWTPSAPMKCSTQGRARCALHRKLQPPGGDRAHLRQAYRCAFSRSACSGFR